MENKPPADGWQALKKHVLDAQRAQREIDDIIAGRRAQPHQEPVTLEELNAKLGHCSPPIILKEGERADDWEVIKKHIQAGLPKEE